MYLEISPRQVGKTTRLAKMAADHIDAGGIAAIQSFSYHNAECIIRRIRELSDNVDMNKNLFLVSNIERFKESIAGTDVDYYEVRPFVDEFDFVDPENMMYSDDGVYVTTPKFMRVITPETDPETIGNDPLLRLIRRSNYGYTVKTNNHPQWIVNLMKNLPEDKHDTEIFGNFLTTGQVSKPE